MSLFFVSVAECLVCSSSVYTIEGNRHTHKHNKTINTLAKTMKSDSGRLEHVRRMIGIFGSGGDARKF